MYSSASLGDTETKCEDVPTVDDEDETEDSEGGRGSLRSVSDHFPLDTQGSPREDRSSPAEDSMDRMESGQCFIRKRMFRFQCELYMNAAGKHYVLCTSDPDVNI